MDIPFLNLKMQYKSIHKEIDRKVLDLIKSQKFIMGEEVEGLEKEIADYSNVKFATAVSSGSDALLAGLMASGIQAGDTVITTPFTFFATAGSVARLGAKPAFCDIDPETFNINPEKLKKYLKTEIEKKNNFQIKGIIAVHLFGQMADMAPLLELSQKYDLFMIEDAAQALGAEYPMDTFPEKACSLGNLGVLSFYPSKNLGGYGDAGMVLTNDNKLDEKLKLLRVHGSRGEYLYEILGGNFRCDALQAGVLRIKFKHLEKWHAERQEKAAVYDSMFKETGLADNGLVRIPYCAYKTNEILQNYHVYHQYVVRVQKRDLLQEFLKEKGIQTAVYYPLPLHLQKCFSYLGYKRGDFPESEKASAEVLALPIYPELKESHQETIVAFIKEFYEGPVKTSF